MEQNPKCPKCNSDMYELDEEFENMSEGQEADYLAGFSHPFSCSKCGYNDLRDVEMVDFDEDDFEYDDSINEEVIEDLIDRAIDKRCFIEVLSLVHNVVELYLRFRIKKYILEKENGNEEKAREKFNILFGSKNKRVKKYLHDYKELCYILGLIEKSIYEKITRFNTLRNRAIHEILKDTEIRDKDVKYSEIIYAAKLGREIQLRLSPVNLNEEAIRKIIKRFEIGKQEAEDDPFLSQ